MFVAKEHNAYGYSLSVDLLVGCGTAPCPHQWNRITQARAISRVEQVLLARVKYVYHPVIRDYNYIPHEQLL